MAGITALHSWFHRYAVGLLVAGQAGVISDTEPSPNYHRSATAVNRLLLTNPITWPMKMVTHPLPIFSASSFHYHL